MAVLAVVANHFSRRVLPGGYLGVDVFFVISGFVITGTLARQQASTLGDLLLNFYSRRLRRLVPALTLVVVVTGLLICLVNPNPGRHLLTGMGAELGLANLSLFSVATDYFATATELNPFTHTWSLGVEEQFYLLFPLLVWLCGFGRRSGSSSDANDTGGSAGRQRLALVMAALSALSLLAFLELYPHQRSAAYFLMPSRLWELGVGCLLFLGLMGPPPGKDAPPQHHRQLGLSPFLITTALLLVMELPPSQAVASTSIVVALTALLIASLRPGTAGHRLFSAQPLVALGRLSYSLYLWHWGVLAISRWTIGIHPWTVPLQLGLMLLLAAATYRWVEQPLRQAEWSPQRWRTIALGLAWSLAGMLTLLGFNRVRSGLYQGGSTVYRDNRLYESLVIPCEGHCRGHLVVAGDSHAGHLGALAELLHQRDGLAVHLHARGEGIPDVPDQQTFLTPVLRHYGNHLGPGDLVLLSTFDPEGLSAARRADYREAVELAGRSGAEVVIVGPTPWFDGLEAASHCNPAWFRPSWAIPPGCRQSIPRRHFEQRLAANLREFRSLSRSHRHVHLFDAMAELCPPSQSRCSSERRGHPLYKDDDHLTSYAAESLYGPFHAFLRQRGLLPGAPASGSIQRRW